MSCMFVTLSASSKAGLSKLIKREQKRGVSVRPIAERKVPKGYAAVIHVCTPASTVRLSRETRKWATARLVRFFGLTK